MGKNSFCLILMQIFFAFQVQAGNSVFAPSNGTFVAEKPAPRAKAITVKMPARTPTAASATPTATASNMGLAVTAKPAAASALVGTGSNIPALPGQPLVGPQNISGAYNPYGMGMMPPTAPAPDNSAAQMAALSKIFQNFGNGSGLGGPNGSGKSAYTQDYSDYTDSNGVYHSSKSVTHSRSSKPAGSGSGSGGGYRCKDDSNGDMKLTGTFYNLPYEDQRLSYASYHQFINKDYLGNSYITGTKIPNGGAVNMEGSGVCSDSSNSACGAGQGGNIIHYTGHITENPCPSYFGEAVPPAGGSLSRAEAANSLDPSSARAGGPNCIVPFYSVAADEQYPRGTILEIPEFKNKTIYLPPNGIKKPHPELFMVGDRGSAITGHNRFDFFTGSYEQKDDKNVFGNSSPDGDMQMDIKSCRNHVVAIKPGDPVYAEKLKEIQQSLRDATGQKAEGPTTTVATQ